MTDTFFGVLIGGIITFLVARHYYQRAARELRDEAKKLRHLTTLGLRVNEREGKADFRWDESGEIVGEHLHFKANVAARSQTSTPNLQVDDLVEDSACADPDLRREE